MQENRKKCNYSKISIMWKGRRNCSGNTIITLIEKEINSESEKKSAKRRTTGTNLK